jgi:FtsP/CotA-like multicopper oxidase with cupredoxin domain
MTTLSRRDLFATAGFALAAGSLGLRAEQGDTQTLALECATITRTIGGMRVRLRAFNGTVPGPLIKTKPGQLLRVRVKNSLPPYDSKGWPGNHNVPHALDRMNLHLHGLDIAPHLFEPPGTSNPTAKMVEIRRGESYEYAFQLPDDHPPGLYWYHSHLHGSTAVQAVSGMAGGLVVVGDIDEVPEIKAARDIPLVIQDLGLFPGPTGNDPWSYEFEQNAIWNSFTGKVTKYNPKTNSDDPTNLKSGFTTGDYAMRFFLLNGEPFFQEAHNPSAPQSPTGTQLTPPQIQMAPGEVVRFRMLNACSDNMMPIVVDRHELYLLALDGVNFPEVRVLPVYSSTTGAGQVQLSPANRAEFLIKASSTPGTYAIRQLAQNDQFLTSDAKVIANIVVANPAKPMALPTKLPAPKRYFPIDPDPHVHTVRNVLFAGTIPPVLNPYVGVDFTVNNNCYDEAAVPFVVALNSTELWNVEQFGQHHGGTEGHPFHIHVNHFEPIKLVDKTDPNNPKTTLYPPGTFLDTVWVPAKCVVTIRMRFKQWTGKTVFHCHILPHEDTGMMQNFLIA